MDGQATAAARSARTTPTAWDCVRTWPGLRSEVKQAWRLLWHLAGDRPDSVWISYRELGEHLGTSERAGRRYIDTLSARRLAALIERAPGRVKLYLWDPREVVGGLDRKAPDDNRPLIGATDRNAQAAPVLSEPPADPPAVAPPTFGESASASPLPSAPLEPLETIGQRRPTHSAPQPPAASTSEARQLEALAHLVDQARLSAGPPPPRYRVDRPHAAAAAPQAIGHQLEARAAQLAAAPTLADTEAAVESLVAEIRARVADSALRVSPALRVAQAVVAGDLPRKELVGILAWLETNRRAGTLRGPAWSAFVGAARRAFARHSLNWPTTEAPR